MTPKDPNPHGDPRDPGNERDAHLLAALRHAPDRDAAPPPAVSATILARARAAAQRGGTSDVQPWWRALTSWALGPQGMAAFGTLAVATVVAVMWSTQVPPEPATPVAAAPPPAAMSGARQDTPEPAAAPSSDRGVLAQGTASRNGVAAEATEAARPPGRTELASKASAANARGTTPPAAPAVDKSVGETAAAAPSQERRAVADAAGAAPRADEAPSAAVRPSASRLRQEADAAGPTGQRAAAAGDPLLRAERLLKRAPGDATWHSGGAAWPHGPAQQQWWAQLREATRGRWQRDDRPGDLSVPWLVLSVASAEDVVLAIEGGALRLQIGTERWMATLPAPTLRELRDAVSRW